MKSVGHLHLGGSFALPSAVACHRWGEMQRGMRHLGRRNATWVGDPLQDRIVYHFMFSNVASRGTFGERVERKDEG